MIQEEWLLIISVIGLTTIATTWLTKELVVYFVSIYLNLGYTDVVDTVRT